MRILLIVENNYKSVEGGIGMRVNKVFLAIFIGLITLSLASCTQSASNNDTTAYKIEKQENWTSINEEVFVSTSEQNKVNLVLVKSGSEVILIDTGYEEAQGLRVQEFIKENNLHLNEIILTHMHEDQINNLNMFKENGVKVTTPIGAKDNQLITLGDKTLKLIHTPGHSGSNHFSIEINNEILVAGDIVTTDEITETCITHNEHILLIETLKRLSDKKYQIIIPGHGDICEDNTILSKVLKDKTEELAKHIVIKDTKNWIEIDNDIFVSVSNYLVTNMVLVVSDNEATLIDTGYKLPEAQAVKKYIDDNNLTLKNLILTHRHYDHDTNIDMFADNNIKFFEYNNSSDNQLIEMGDKKLRIIFTPGHASNQHLSVEINDKVLVAGDIVLSSLNITRALADDGDKDALISTLERLKKKNYSLIIPGHGDICIGDSILYEHVQTLLRDKTY